MSVFVYAENINGEYKKTTLEAISYAKALADKISTSLIAITINPTESVEKLYQFGANKVITIKDASLKNFDNQYFAKAINAHFDGQFIIFPQTNEASAIATSLSVKNNISLITNVIELPENISPLQVKRKIFSGKAFSIVKSNTERNVLSIAVNSFGVKENPTIGTEEVRETNISESQLKISSREEVAGSVNLKDAEIVVSGGRGLKSPDNWHIITDLANALNGALACSKPVSDNGWRPHEEHIGQTGTTISPNLYIAVGISGAIQHLAGVNSSKTIVVINTDAEAPFFKSADYGVVGDAFEVLPKLTEKIKNFKN